MARKTIQQTKDEIQKTVCQDVYATSDVVKSQIFATVVQNLRNVLDTEALETMKLKLDSAVDSQTSSLVDRIIKSTS
tara:strand:- start:717 stop:947 length:231 start_codon:yes stop_codon:yes gene_type:complete